MALNHQNYMEQLRLVQERYPDVSIEKLMLILEEHDGDFDEVCNYFEEKKLSQEKFNSLEACYGTVLTRIQTEYPIIASVKRSRLLRMMDRFGGDVERIREHLEKCETNQNNDKHNSNAAPHQHLEEIKTKYASQLVELKAIGVNIHNPCILQQLERYHGDTSKVLEKIKHREEKKSHITQLDTTYASQIAQLEADGIKIKNKRLLIELLEKSEGQVDVVKQLLAERKEQKNQTKSLNSNIIDRNDEILSSSAMHLDIDIDQLRELRAAGLQGNPMKILALFHQCNQSIEMTVARYNEAREKREQQCEKRIQQRIQLAEIHDAYLSLNKQNDWPDNIEKVYFHGNSMMLVIDLIRRLCLNQDHQRAEQAISEIAAAWNEHMLISHVELIFDFTHNLESVQNIKISSARPTYNTTEDMLIDMTQRSRNYDTIIVTSDQTLASHLKHEGCQLVKPYQWFVHCAMLLTPELYKHENTIDRKATTKNKIRYDLDELVRRIAKIDL